MRAYCVKVHKANLSVLKTLGKMENSTSVLVNLNNTLETVDYDEVLPVEEDMLYIYTVVIPIFLTASLVTFALNLVIILAFPLIRNLSKVSYLPIFTYESSVL